MSDEPFDQAGFDAWLAGGPGREALFQTMWRRVMGPGMERALKAYDRRRRARAGAAAGAAVILLAGGWAASPRVELALARPQDYAAPAGAVRDVRLADGTRLTLAGGAAVRVRYARALREVELERGTLFAAVAHDKRRPFRVEAGDGRVTVTGTRFEVSRKPAFVHVAVEEGHVRFGRARWFSQPIELTTDQAGTLGASGLVRDADVGRGGVARWRAGWAEYRDTPMRQVIADLESVSPLPIEVASRGLADLRVSGRIRLAQPERQLENLAVIYDFNVERRADAIVLSAR